MPFNFFYYGLILAVIYWGGTGWLIVDYFRDKSVGKEFPAGSSGLMIIWGFLFLVLGYFVKGG